jgi:WS/DGAT/MGAT family acyltransferase
MRQLTTMDTSFLTMEGPNTYGHVSSLLTLDPSGTEERFDADRVRRVLEERLHLLEPFRWRLVEVPMDVDRPYWINDPDFDLDFHVRELALPAPGDDEQLSEQVARIVARPLDRSRPLWELYVIHGLEGGRVAILTKMHHAAVDGASGVEILTTLMDVERAPAAVPPPEEEWKPDPVPSAWELLGRSYLGALQQPVKLWRAQQRLAQAALRRAPEEGFSIAGRPDGTLLNQPPAAAPRTSFNRVITPHRRFAFGSLALEEVKAVKNARGVTVNDVVLGLTTGALRRWLIAHDELPEDPLLTMIPVSVRTEGESGSYGNRVSMMVVPLPTNEADPARQLSLIHDSTKAAKEQFKALPAEELMDFAEFTPPALMAQAARTTGRLRIADTANPPVNLVVSNVPGPAFPLYLAGAQLEHMYPVSTITDGMGLNVTVMSYLGSLDIGLIACRELLPDVWSLLGWFRDALDDLKALPG